MEIIKRRALDEGVSSGELLKQREQLTAERFVVFLDIMGFKDRVARTSHDELREQLSFFNKEITRLIGANQNVQLSQFSDSIVLFSPNADSTSLLTIAEVACGIMKKAIEQGIPLKGAIAQGEVTCDMSKQLFFGQALIDAYLLEENVQYYGILVHHSVEKAVHESKSELFRDIYAPLKSGNIKHYELAWHLEEKDDIEENLKKIRQTVSDAPRKYIDNTLRVMNDSLLG